MGDVVVQVPRFLSSLLKGEKEISLEASTLADAFKILAERYGEDVKRRLLDENGNLRAVLNIYVNGKNARFTGGLGTPLNPGDKIAILPAVAGG